MSERFVDIEKCGKGKKGLEERLNAHPLLRDRMEMLLRVVENAAGNAEKADEAERLVLEEIRQMGNAALQSWAEDQHKKKVEEFQKSKGGSHRRKKNSTGTPYLEKSK